jgi:putative transposase
MMLLWPWAKLEWRAVCAERRTYGSGRRSASALLTPLKVIGWGWFYLSTVLDDFSRRILAWKLCTTMSATDVSDTLQIALQTSELNQVKVLHRPRLLSDNGPSYLSNDLANWLDHNGIRHIHESLDNLTPADVYFGRGPTILKRRESIERKTIQQRRRLHQQAIAA